MRILIVDDNEVARDVLTHALTQATEDEFVAIRIRFDEPALVPA